MKQKIKWFKFSETEWIYCGAEGEVEWDVIEREFDNFFDDGIFYISSTRNNSFDSEKKNLLSSLQTLVGVKNFLVWNQDFKKAIEFNHIGVFRKGSFNSDTYHPSPKIFYNKITQGSPDKVKGKLVKYKRGDCLSIDCNDGNYLAAFISEKYNKYYDFTLIDFCKKTKPTIEDFIKGKFAGNLVGLPDGYLPGIQKHMLECLYIDASNRIEMIGSINLLEPLMLGGYCYMKDLDELISYYFADIQLRRQKTINAQMNPNLNQQGDRLFEMEILLKH